MKENFRIDLAFCEQINQVVDIQKACDAFEAQHEHSRFDFYCSDPSCRVSIPGGVHVSAPNHHRRSYEDETILRRPHFRKRDDHQAECFWSQLNKVLDEEISDDSGSDDQKKIRALKRKLSRLISRFEIPPTNGDETQSNQGQEIERIRAISDPKERKEQVRRYVSEAGSTSCSLEELVSCYEELKALGALDDIRVTIVNHGRPTFKELFVPFHYKTNDQFSILYGGARLTKDRYGLGFVLAFMDPLKGKRVTLYVSSAQIKSHRHQAHLLNLIKQVEESDYHLYFRVYWIGGIATTGDKLGVSAASLEHMVFRVITPKPK